MTINDVSKACTYSFVFVPSFQDEKNNSWWGPWLSGRLLNRVVKAISSVVGYFRINKSSLMTTMFVIFGCSFDGFADFSCYHRSDTAVVVTTLVRMCPASSTRVEVVIGDEVLGKVGQQCDNYMVCLVFLVRYSAVKLWTASEAGLKSRCTAGPKLNAGLYYNLGERDH